MSRWPAKFAGYFTWTRHLLFFGNNPNLKRVFMCLHWKKGQHLIMSMLCLNTLNFCSRLLKMRSKRPRFQFFSRNSFALQCLQVTPSPRGFSFSIFSKAFATYFKSYWKPLLFKAGFKVTQGKCEIWIQRWKLKKQIQYKSFCIQFDDWML